MTMIDLGDVLIILAVPTAVFLIGGVAGYFVGKGAGFRHGIEYARRSGFQSPVDAPAIRPADR